MERANFFWNTKSFIDPIPQLTNCLIRIGDYNNLAWVDVLSLYQILHFCSHRRSLSRTGASHQKAIVIICNHSTTLLLIQLDIGVDLL